jgi:hypothetical protein
MKFKFPHIPRPHLDLNKGKKVVTQIPDLSNLATKDDIRRIESRMTTRERREFWNSLPPSTQRRFAKYLAKKQKGAKNED